MRASPVPHCGVDGVAWAVNRRAAVHLGWGRALLLQLAHPLVAVAVAEHSVVGTRPGAGWRRWHRTLEALCAMTAGPPEESARVARAINAVHGRVRGELREPAGSFGAGTAYDARDPALLRWVHATTVESLLVAHERFVGPLAPGDRDRYCAGMVPLGALLGVAAADLPRSAAELDRYLAAMLRGGEVAVTPTARDLARGLLGPAFPRWAWPLRPLGRLATVGLLPPAIRDAYGFAWGPRHEAALGGGASLVGRLQPLLPSLPTALEYARWVDAVPWSKPGVGDGRRTERSFGAGRG